MRPPHPSDPAVLRALRTLAARYIWWMPPEVALRYPARVVAQVMTRGDFGDVEHMAQLMGDDYLRHVLGTAQAGWFTPRAWHYWHYRLGLTEPGTPPPEMPARPMPAPLPGGRALDE